MQINLRPAALVLLLAVSSVHGGQLQTACAGSCLGSAFGVLINIPLSGRQVAEVVADLALALMAWVFWRQRVSHDKMRKRQLEIAAIEHARNLAIEKECIAEALRIKSHVEANINHEIRPALKGLFGTLNLVLMTALTVEQRQYLELTRSAAESLQALLEDLSNFSAIAIDDLKLSRIEFALERALRDSVLSVNEPAKKKELCIRTETAKDVPNWLMGDPARLHQVLTRILENAVKYSSGGEVLVSVRRESETPLTRSASQVEAGSVVLLFSVRDWGIGIPDDKRELILEPFQQVDNSTARKYEGVGLGLAICRRLVRLMDGRIWVESEVGHGSICHFTAKFEIGNEATTEDGVHAGDSTWRSRDLRRLQVLLVEDNRVNQVVTRRFLEQRGFHCLVANNGREAMEMLDRAAADLILMDVQMPEMDGFEATRCIRELEKKSGAHVPILALTAHAMQGDQEKCVAAGMDGYVSKPVQPSLLFKAIDALIGCEAHPQRTANQQKD